MIAPAGIALPPRSWRLRALVALALVGAALLAYGRTFAVPFLFDDIAAIPGNPTIRDLGALGTVLSPPHAEGTTVGGRPILNLTLALNHALGGTAVAGYHAVNLLLHVAAAWLLFALVDTTLARSPHERLRRDATGLAFASALLWLLHPLQTESVTYVIQRAEILVAFFYLFTLLALVRAADCATQGCIARQRAWQAAGVAACLFGMGTKEVMVGGPLLALLYDRTFLAGSFRAAWRARRGFYLALAASWLPLLWLVAGAQGRGGTAGLGTEISSWHYALTQSGALVHYLRLVAWPQPLIFDYGEGVVAGLGAVWPQLLAVLALLTGTLVALRRWPAGGFLGAVFFIVLAPSSSVVPIVSQTIAEHRMYLPLAAVVVALVLAAHALLGRRAGLVALVVAAGVSGVLTWERNETYRSELALWTDTVQHRPGNARAHNNLANLLLAHGRTADALAHYTTAVQLRPDYADAHNNLGRALITLDRGAEALPHLELAVQLKPDSIDIRTNLGAALVQADRARDALPHYAHALRLDPSALGPRYNLANAQLALGDLPAAIASYEEVLHRQPAHLDARFNLASVLLRARRTADALGQYEEVLRLAPQDAAAHAEIANILAHTGRVAEAIAHYEAALRLRPDFIFARDELARLRAIVPPTRP